MSQNIYLIGITGGGLTGPFSASYDADGLRAEKTGTVPGGSQQATFFAYDGDTPLVEMNAAGAITAVNVFGPDGLEARGDLANNQTLLYSFDPQGNTVLRVGYSGSAGTVGLSHQATPLIVVVLHRPGISLLRGRSSP